MLGWAVVRTQPQRERTAVDACRAQGFEVWSPQVDGGRPLFPSYIFVLVVDVWRCLLGTRGVVDVLRPYPDAEPSRVGALEMDYLRALEGPDGLVTLPPRFRRGDRLRVERGMLADCVGLCAGMRGLGRVRVLFTMLGRPVEQVIHEADLSPA